MQAAVNEARRRFRPIERELPLPLRAGLARHEAHLAALVRAMEEAGFDSDRIGACVRTMLDLYEDDLLAEVRRVRRA